MLNQPDELNCNPEMTEPENNPILDSVIKNKRIINNRRRLIILKIELMNRPTAHLMKFKHVKGHLALSEPG